MAWQDRPYYRSQSSGRMNPLMWLLTGSVPLFTIFGIRVRAHAMMLIFILSILLFGYGQGSTAAERVQGATILFGVVLLHEFGHCFAARRVGGSAEDILLTPIGGLAFTMAPRKPWPTFLTVAGGPLVNLIICVVCGIAMFFLTRRVPLLPSGFSRGYPTGGWSEIYSYLFWIYTTSYTLFWFNILPFFPLDGGQMLQTILWRPMGYYRSMLLTVTVGIAGGVFLIASGLLASGVFFGGMFAVFIGISCLLTCLNMRKILIAEGPWGFADEDAADFSASLAPDPPRRKPGYFQRRRQTKLRNLARAEAIERQRVDQILAKVSISGMNSLTRGERKALRLATERQRQRDAELRSLTLPRAR